MPGSLRSRACGRFVWNSVSLRSSFTPTFARSICSASDTDTISGMPGIGYARHSTVNPLPYPASARSFFARSGS